MNKNKRPFFKISLVYRVCLIMCLLVLLKCLVFVTFIGLGNRLYAKRPATSGVLYTLTWPFVYQSEVPHFNMGQVYYAQKKYPQAVAEYQKALNALNKTDKRQCVVRIQLTNAMLRPLENEFDNGKINDHKKEVDDAIALLLGCLVIDPENTDALHNIAVLKSAQAGSPSKPNTDQTDQSTPEDETRQQEVQKGDQSAQKAQREFNNNEAKGNGPSYDFGPNW